jgi:plastocyanin
MKRIWILMAAAALAGCSSRGATEGLPGSGAADAPAAPVAAPETGPVATEAPELTESQLAAQRVERIEVGVDPSTIRVGDSATLTVAAYDEAGERVRGGAARLVVGGRAARFSTDGRAIVGESPGRAEVIVVIDRPDAAGEGAASVRGSAIVEVLPAPVSRIELEVPSERVFAGTRLRLGAVAHSDFGRRDDARIGWRSSDETVLKMSANGTVAGMAPGIARVTAAFEGVTAETEMRVVVNPVRRLVVEPVEAEVRAGDVVHFSASALEASGEVVAEAEPAVQWSVAGLSQGAEAGAQIEFDGAFVANEAGLYQVVATLGGISEVAEVRAVRRPPRHHVKLQAHGVVPVPGGTTDLWVFEGVDGLDYAYTGTMSAATMYAWDVTDPANPVITDSVEVDGRRANDVKINADASLAIITSEGASNRRNGFTILDISEPAHPRVLTHFTEGLTGGVHNVWIEGDIVYAVHNGTNAVHIVDISNPLNPRNVGRWQVEREGRSLHDVMVKDGLAYVSYWNDGLLVLDVGAGIEGGTPTEPALVSQLTYRTDWGGELYGNTHHAIRYRNYVFLSDEIFGCSECVNGPRGYVHVIDVTDIGRPHEVAMYRVPEAGAHNLWVEDDRLYVAYYQAGLRVVDVSGELRGDLYRQGREIAWYPTEDAEGTVPYSAMAWGPQPYKGSIFVSDMYSGLWVVQIEEPEPELVP